MPSTWFRARRALTVLVCYALSSWGLLGSVMLVVFSDRHGPGAGLAVLLVLLAWSVHLLMALNWVLDRRLGAPWPWVGAAAAAALLLGLPLLTAEWPGLLRWAQAVGVGLLLTAPSVLLGLHLLRFHLRRATQPAQDLVPAGAAAGR